MGNDDWRARLQKAIDDSGMSYRAVSLAANKGPGYIHSILSEGKDPSVNNLIAVCEVVGVSLSHVLYGFDISPETEEILTLLQEDPGARPALLALLRKRDAA